MKPICFLIRPSRVQSRCWIAKRRTCVPLWPPMEFHGELCVRIHTFWVMWIQRKPTFRAFPTFFCTMSLKLLQSQVSQPNEMSSREQMAISTTLYPSFFWPVQKEHKANFAQSFEIFGAQNCEAITTASKNPVSYYWVHPEFSPCYFSHRSHWHVITQCVYRLFKTAYLLLKIGLSKITFLKLFLHQTLL